MPLPWKNNKLLRISRLVAGLNHSPKRCGSLVVETGFPTSLVDLFVKNKDRLKKPSKKKTKNSQIDISSPVLVTPLPTPLPAVPASGADATRDGSEIRSGASAHVEDQLVVVDECEGGGSMKRSVFAVVLKAFVVVALALSTRRLAVGITMSAFLLLLLEYAGPQLLIFLQPCSKARTFFVSYIEKFKFLSLSKSNNEAVSLNNIQRYEEDSNKDLCGPCELVYEIEFNSSVKEIQVVDSNCEMESWETIVEEYERKVDVLIGKKKQSKVSKIRSKIVKKFVKLHNTKRGKKGKEKEMETSSEAFSYMEDDRCGRIHRGANEKQVYIDKRLRYQLEDENCTGLGISDDGSTSFSTQSQAPVEEIVEHERKGNYGYLILFLIVLAGLVGGRVLALVITVAWCLVSKWMGRLRPVPISS